jgi:hypothetical protein
MEKKICSKCKEEKEICEFNKKSISNKGIQYYKSRCKLCQSEDDKIKRDKNPEKYKSWYDNNREKRNKWRSEYYQKNKEKILNQNKNYVESTRINRRKKYNEDDLFKVRHILSNRMRYLLKIKSFNKKQKFNKVIGCTSEFLKEHLEKQFTDGMSWDNHGQYGWHIDHIIPLSSAKTEEEIYKLCHYTNLQPLWAEDNLRKSNKILI